MDRVRAKNWYFWLWLSPLLTIPTLGIIWLLLPVYGPTWPILGSALWHLILLVLGRTCRRTIGSAAR